MGTWGSGTFENDGALDLLGAFQDEPTPATLTQAFAIEPFLGEVDDESALAAAEIVAVALGRPSPSLVRLCSEAAFDFARVAGLAITPALVETARAAVARILEPETTLHALWRGAGDERPDSDFQKWLGGVRDLESRLSAGSTP